MPIMHLRFRCSLLLLVTLFVPVVAAAQEGPLELTRLSGPITMDGRLDDPAWQAVPALPLTMYLPVFRGTPTQRTEIRVAYDDEHFYVGGWFYDTDPSGIRVNSLYRDRWNGDDALAIYIDAFNDNQNAKWFGTTPAGMRFDLLVSDDGNTLNENWDSFWTSRTAITGEGWFAKCGSRSRPRLPGRARRPRGDGVDGDAARVAARRARDVPGDRSEAIPFRRPSAAQGRRAAGRPQPHAPVRDAVRAGRRVAQLRGGAGRRADATPSPTQPAEIGLDVRYPLSGNLTLDLTANTDFAQVEADEQQVALDRFPLFFPERRRFFQEGAASSTSQAPAARGCSIHAGSGSRRRINSR
jgi:hypothetical protein